MQHVEVRHAVERARQPVIHEARLDQRRVKGPAVVSAERAVILQPRLHFRQQRALVLETRHQELADADRGAFDRRAADEKRLRAGTAKQAGRFKIEKQQLRSSRRVCRRSRADAGS